MAGANTAQLLVGKVQELASPEAGQAPTTGAPPQLPAAQKHQPQGKADDKAGMTANSTCADHGNEANADARTQPSLSPLPSTVA